MISEPLAERHPITGKIIKSDAAQAPPWLLSGSPGSPVSPGSLRPGETYGDLGRPRGYKDAKKKDLSVVLFWFLVRPAPASFFAQISFSLVRV